MLNTLASGQPAGTANTSPRKASRGWSTTQELANPSVALIPAVRRADGLAGSTPRLAAMAIPLEAAPRAMTAKPGILRLRTRNAPATT